MHICARLVPSYFNSIKVQLKPVEIQTTQLDSLFQFHKGTIKTICLIHSSTNGAIFQFHKGTIKTKSLIFYEQIFTISIP